MLTPRRERLPNGLRVIYVPMAGLHSANAALYVRMGPRFESPEDNGLSHFVEHVVFKGSERLPDSEAVARETDAAGADLNGATEPEHVEFLASSHHRHFRRTLELLAELVLRPRLDPADVETERKVILEESSQYRDLLGVNVGELAYKLMWRGESHHFQCLGPEENIRRFSADDLRRHYRRFLTASNMVLCVAGNFGESEVGDVVAAEFGSLPRGEPLACATLRDGQRAPRHLFRRGRARRAYVRLCHKACSYVDPRLHPVLVASEILGGGVTSRLFARLREREGLVYDVSSGTTHYSDCGWVDIATVTSPANAEAALGAALDEIRRLADEGIEDEYLGLIKERAACHMEILEDGPPDVAEWFGVREILFAPDPLLAPTDEAERLKSVTVEQVQAAAQDVFVPARRSLVVVGPCTPDQRRRFRELLTR